MDNEPLVEFIPVAKQELVLIVPEGHPLDGKTSIDLKEALTYPHIVFSKRSGLRHVIDFFYFTASVRSYLPKTNSPASQAPWPGSCLRLENRESLRSGNQLQEAGSLHMP